MKIKEINISDNQVLQVFNSVQQVKNSVFGWLDCYKTIYMDQDNSELIKDIEDFEKVVNDMQDLNLNVINENMEFLTFKYYIMEF